jgi:hypothetical protein
MLNLNEYDSFGGFNFYVTLFLWALAAGLCFCAIMMSLKRNVMINAVKQMIRHGARTEDGAKTLKELRISKSRQFLKIYETNSLFRRAVKTVGEKEISYEEYIAEQKRLKKEKKKKKVKKIKAIRNKQSAACEPEVSVSEPKTDARYYTPKECELEANRILSKRETSLFQSILFCVLVFCLCACLTLLMPNILDFLDTLLA